MKKLFAILLFTVYLFNLAGYSFLFQYLINDADAQMVQRLDHISYDDKDLVEIKVSLNMPYITATKDFERVDGHVELNGVHYNYVKRKVSGDTLYLLCLPNFSKTQLYKAKADYAKAGNDIPAGKKNTESFVKKPGFGNEYNCVTVHFFFSAQTVLTASQNGFLCASIENVFIQSPIKPPGPCC